MIWNSFEHRPNATGYGRSGSAPPIQPGELKRSGAKLVTGGAIHNGPPTAPTGSHVFPPPRSCHFTVRTFLNHSSKNRPTITLN